MLYPDVIQVILYITPLVSQLKCSFTNCKHELEWLYMHINVKKSCYLRIGQIFNATCTRITTGDGHIKH